MLNKPVLIGLFFLPFLVLIAGWFFPVPWYAYLLSFGVFFCSVIYGSFFISSQVFLQAVCKAESTKKVIALTFDDGPEENVTPQVLDFLKQHNIPATFFCIGKKIIKNRTIVLRALNEGHILGNHSYSHSYWFDFFPKKMVVKELNQTKNLMEATTGKVPRFFRPPYGVTNFSIADAVSEVQDTVIGWNIRSLDTIIRDPNRLMHRIEQKLEPGSILLLHDNQPGLIEFLPKLLELLEKENYKIVPLDQLIGQPAYK